MIRSVGLVVAVSAGKRLLTSVRSHVIFQRVSSIAGKIALVTLKRLLARMSEYVVLEVGSP